MLDSGANYKVITTKKKTPAQLAEENRKTEIAKFIPEYYQKLQVELKKTPQIVSELKAVVQQQQNLIQQQQNLFQEQQNRFQEQQNLIQEQHHLIGYLSKQIRLLTASLKSTSFKSDDSQVKLIADLSSL